MTEQTTEERPYWNPIPPTRDGFDEADRDALDQCIRLVLDEGPDESHVVREYLKENDWWGAASQACYHRQIDHLQLDAESPPCWIDENEIDQIIARGPGNHNNDYSGALLLQKMLALGVSKWQPQPIDAVAAAQHKRKRGK